jgi:hypothetical protein
MDELEDAMLRKTILALGLVLAAAGVTPASAAHLVEAYNAYLGRDDHFNSNGERLTTAAAIIRQDRANYHKFGVRDRGDQGDSFFDDVNNRAYLERLIAQGSSNEYVLRRIVRDNVMVHVEVFGSRRHGDYVIVTLVDD